MTDSSIERPNGVVRRFQELPEVVREVVLAAFLLAIMLPPFQMVLDLYSASQIERAHSREFRQQILGLVKQRPDLVEHATKLCSERMSESTCYNSASATD